MDISVYISLSCQSIRYTCWYLCVYLVKTFHKPFDGKMKLLRSIYSHQQLNIDCGFSFKVEFYLEGLLKPVTSHKNLVADDLRTIGRHFGWVFNILYLILYKEYQSIIYYDTNVTIIIFMCICNVHNGPYSLLVRSSYFISC